MRIVFFMCLGLVAAQSELFAQAQQSAGEYDEFGIYAATAPRAAEAEPVTTMLPLKPAPNSRIVLVGNTLFERNGEFGQFEAMLQQQFPNAKLTVRHLAWSADEVAVQPRPANFADTEQHLTHEKADIILAAFGFNESFAGAEGLDQFREELTVRVRQLQSRSFNGRGAPQVVLISPIACENVDGVAAADLNNERLQLYLEVMRETATELGAGFVDVFSQTEQEMRSPGSDLTINGIHLNQQGDLEFSKTLFNGLFQLPPPQPDPKLTAAIVDRNQQYFRRFRPLNTFYYTGGRNGTYGYLDFLPAMRNFDLMVQHRDQRIHDLAAGRPVPEQPDDSGLPQLPAVAQSRGANEWLSAAEEKKAFRMDPRFEVNLFAGEEEFPEIANPIQMRWDSRGRLWVSCSTTYPHIYPGNEPDDRLVILEDTDGDGRADTAKTFADGLHIPLSFEFGDGGVYVSEQPCMTFLKDTDGDDRADERTVILSGFGTEDSHHSLHDFTWTPDGDLILRESVFHHSQVETPYGPVRQQNSGWFRFEPRTHRLLSFGTYSSTNPWGVTFDDWGQHMASHPVYAAAFHSLDPPYPDQHPGPRGLQAYSGVCGHQIVQTQSFPDELQGHFIKVRYKPTNRVEILKWKEGPFGFQEEYVGDLLFSTNLSFIPVDLQFGPRGDLYVCDWYNPVKGHMQYSLRDDRRDRHSGRIWRITAKNRSLAEQPKIAGADVSEVLDLLKRQEPAVRYLARRELRNRDGNEVLRAMEEWISALQQDDPRYEHHLLESVWVCRSIGLATMAESVDLPQPTAVRDSDLRRMPTLLIRTLLDSDNHLARAAATQQLRYWHIWMSDGIALLRKSANDPSGIVRMEAAMAASWIGSREAFDAMLDVLKYPRSGHTAYAIRCALGSRTLRRYWEGDLQSPVPGILQAAAREDRISEPKPTREERAFDKQSDLKSLWISCVPERMLFTTRQFVVRPGQPVKLVFSNADATNHNLAILMPGAEEEVGAAANAMARDPRNAMSDFLPPQKSEMILQATSMIGPSRNSRIDVLRFTAPEEPGIYPYLCTFPGHWVVMNGRMVVAESDAAAEAMLQESLPKVVREWSIEDFPDVPAELKEESDEVIARGMTAFVRARCSQCHMISGHGVNLGPKLTESVKKLKGRELLRHILEPSLTIHEDFQAQQFLLLDGRVITGVVMQETDDDLQVATSLLTPGTLTQVRRSQIEERLPLRTSPMPEGLLNTLTKEQILDLLAFVERGDYELPEHLRHMHQHREKPKQQEGR